MAEPPSHSNLGIVFRRRLRFFLVLWILSTTRLLSRLPIFRDLGAIASAITSGSIPGPGRFGQGRTFLGAGSPYSHLRGQAVSGEARIDFLVATKDPQLIQIGHTPGKSGKKLG
jgi:hypothetical protein